MAHPYINSVNQLSERLSRRMSRVIERVGRRMSQAGRRLSQITPRSRRASRVSQVNPPEEFQVSGAQINRWINDPNEPDCHIRPSTLTFADLGVDSGQVLPMNLDPKWEQTVTELGLVNEFANPVEPTHSAYRYLELQRQPDLIYVGWVGPGIILLHTLFRRIGPNISEIAGAFYRNYFDIASLRYIMLSDVVNFETYDLVRDSLYSGVNVLQWRSLEPRTWDTNTPEFYAILGTRIGRLVANIVLGSFSRGTRQIRRIVTWPGRVGIDMRFDIGP